jgi:histidine triad (HIT) family protein
MPDAYDPSNAFAKILRGELPAHKVYEDADTLAFMDIMPRADGHCLVIPKAPSRGLLDADPTALAAVMTTVQRVARAATTAFAADGITVQQFNEEAGGQVVFHLHVHVLPRRAGVPLRPHTGEMADNAVLAEHAKRLAEAIAAARQAVPPDEGLRLGEITTENDR